MATVASTSTWAEHPELAAFYATHRRRPEDLYPSERKFVPWLAAQGSSVLDVGCAAGGFKDIWRHYNPVIRYRGVDLSPSLIDTAQRLHPDGQFLQGDCAAGLPLPDRCADVVQALGWLHWEPRYPAAIRELWRLTGTHLFLDVRIRVAGEEDLIGRQKLAFAGSWDGRTMTPYVAVGWRAFAQSLLALQPARILGYGYRGAPAETVIDLEPDICFAVFVLQRAPIRRTPSRPTVCLDLPMPWPDRDRGHVLEAERLEALLA